MKQFFPGGPLQVEHGWRPRAFSVVELLFPETGDGAVPWFFVPARGSQAVAWPRVAAVEQVAARRAEERFG